MKLVVGLGNPGLKYNGTRHNIGFEVLARLARHCSVSRPKSKFNAEIADTVVGSEKIVLLSPLTYMNLSGQSVRAAFDFYKLQVSDILVICDDLALPVSRLRLKPGGSAGGQKGLNDIINKLGTRDIPRLRVGIGQPPARWDTADYVLGRFTDQEQPEIEQVIGRATLAVECWIKQGIQEAMNQFNANPNDTE